MVTFIIVVVVVFLVIVISLNFQKIKSLFSKPKNKTIKEEKPIKQQSNLSYEEPVEYEKKVDSLKRDESVAYTEQPFVQATENELKELENKKKSGGRLNGDIKTIKNIDVEVENVGEDEIEDEEIEELLRKKRASTISDQIKNLPPELKALLVSDVLKRKD